MKKNIGIIGNGFVGSAIAAGFALDANVLVYDTDSRRTTHTLEEVVRESQFIFVCVPTPMRARTGKIDVSIIRNVFDEVKSYPTRDDQIFIIKSTTTPTSLNQLISDHSDLRIVFSPEFLTERTARLDFINTSRIVIGGKKRDTAVVEEMFKVRFPYTKIIQTDFITAQFIKYMANSFFATKVAFMNELHQAAETLSIDWEQAMDGFVTDGRIGNSHLSVPGHDGYRGFGGKCFPKDLNAFINMYKNIGVKPTIMSAVWEKNLEIREYHDWFDIPGATSEEGEE
jgi:UDPglucose 6-dehydrogenase